MGTRQARSLSVTLATIYLGVWFPGAVDGLTLFRIGGPPPDEAEGVDVVHLSWEESTIGFGGSVQSLDVEDGRLAPIFLDADRNIARDTIKLGGGPFGAKHVRTENDFHLHVVDGDPTTAFVEEDIQEVSENPFLGLDLGGIMPINRIVFYPTPERQDRFVENFQIYLFAGDPGLLFSPLGSLQHFELLLANEDNRKPRVELTIPTQLAHTVMIGIGNPQWRGFPIQPWEIAEIEVYGEGYAPNASYTSRVLDLGEVSSLGQIRWRERKDRGAQVQIRTRSGADEDPTRYWRLTGRGDARNFRDERGRPLTREQYEGLVLTEQSGTSHDVDNWSFWSAPYASTDSSGTILTSPGPNRFVQFQVTFENQAFSGGELSHLEFEITSPPVVQRVVGEVSPTLAVAGTETGFVYAFKPTFSPDRSEDAESGFDRLDLSTPGELTAVDSVRVNGDRVPCEAWVDEGPVTCADAGDVFPGQSLALQLPRIEITDSGKVVEVFFRARVFRFGTVFDGVVSDSDRPGEVGQAVLDGDATFAFDSNRQSVGVELSGTLLQEVAVSSPVVTPNGDGVNDEVVFQYTLLQLAEGQSVRLDIFDLSGRRVRRVYEGMEASGRRQRRWDGRGESGPLAPGIYMYRLQVDADSRQAERSGTINVAY